MIESDYLVRRISDGETSSIISYFDLCPESPDGQHVVYSQRLDTPWGKRLQVMAASVDGTDRRPLGGLTRGDFHTACKPQWLDKDTVAFFGETEKAETTLVDINTLETRRVPGTLRMYSRQAGLGVGSSHEEHIMGLSRDSESVYLMDLKAGQQTFIFSRNDAIALHPRADQFDAKTLQFKHTKWSLSGRYISAVFHNEYLRSELPPDQICKCIMVYNLQTHRLSYLTDFGHHPSWSRTGDIVVTFDRFSDGRQAFMAHPIDGSKPYAILERAAGVHPTFSPDGSMIVTDIFNSPEPGKGQVALYSVPDGDITVLATFDMPELARDYRCHPHPAWSPDGRRVYFNSADSGTSQVYVVES